MSYDISLTDPVTHKTLTCETPHFMHGGTYALNGTTELWLNVTCNYSDYYRYEKEDGSKTSIHDINNMSALESIPVLENLIEKINKEYKDENGEWKTARRKRHVVYDENGYRTKMDVYEAVYDENGYRTKMDVYEAVRGNIKYTVKTEEFDISEGDTSNYWYATAANALIPLYQLITMAKMRPDGVWDVSC